MASVPTTVSKLESRLCQVGYDSNGVTALRLDADDGGHEWYPEYLSMRLGGAVVEFYERYSEDKVELVASLTPDQLVRVAQAFADTHGSMRNLIQLKAIVTVTTALAVCDAVGGKT